MVEVAADPQAREAVYERPARDADAVRVSIRHRVRGWAIQERARVPSRRGEVRVVDVEEVGPIHHIEVRGMIDRESDVRESDREEALVDLLTQRASEQV